jgi:hypothetical protein
MSTRADVTNGPSLALTRAKSCKIVPDLKRLAFPVDRLTPLPENPRQGDVEAVARSYATFGQRKPIVARHEGIDYCGCCLLPRVGTPHEQSRLDYALEPV